MLMLLLAETSRNGMPSSSARAWPCSVETTRFSSQSHLLPIRILLTPSVACCSTFWNQVRMSVKKLVQGFVGGVCGFKSVGACLLGQGRWPKPSRYWQGQMHSNNTSAKTSVSSQILNNVETYC